MSAPVVRTYPVLGMACGHCADAVTEELTRIPGVTGVSVDVENDTVTVTGTTAVSVAEVGRAVEEAGYELGARPDA
ncbi:heavy-metal-associated domain-containing protein [Streptomyces smyrnaeus]|uniref:heavy-metal-associated domain-containing protein n=1 Tax=Streptomyces TaxID=1883 RepID=UPI000C175904|nr:MULTISPECIES: heavy-metal-associated domain-containing protein [unclassified Streptomyces]MBQ0864146.1 heavy-metal-associated domain-containing protein [Streptomyces sp. RK75]MBQ1120008.1 heavy-metal-associated domain-containing protein [Streptomyces sp. B15]